MTGESPNKYLFDEANPRGGRPERGGRSTDFFSSPIFENLFGRETGIDRIPLDFNCRFRISIRENEVQTNGRVAHRILGMRYRRFCFWRGAATWVTEELDGRSCGDIGG